MQSISEILKKFDQSKNRWINYEFQDYGYRLAEELGDLKHKALYMKLAKNLPREILEQARAFVKEAPKVRSRGKLFMWKLGQIKKEGRQK